MERKKVMRNIRISRTSWVRVTAEVKLKMEDGVPIFSLIETDDTLGALPAKNVKDIVAAAEAFLAYESYRKQQQDRQQKRHNIMSMMANSAEHYLNRWNNLQERRNNPNNTEDENAEIDAEIAPLNARLEERANCEEMLRAEAAADADEDSSLKSNLKRLNNIAFPKITDVKKPAPVNRLQIAKSIFRKAGENVGKKRPLHYNAPVAESFSSSSSSETSSEHDMSYMVFNAMNQQAAYVDVEKESAHSKESDASIDPPSDICGEYCGLFRNMHGWWPAKVSRTRVETDKFDPTVGRRLGCNPCFRRPRHGNPSIPFFHFLKQPEREKIAPQGFEPTTDPNTTIGSTLFPRVPDSQSCNYGNGIPPATARVNNKADRCDMFQTTKGVIYHVGRLRLQSSSRLNGQRTGRSVSHSRVFEAPLRPPPRGRILTGRSYPEPDRCQHQVLNCSLEGAGCSLQSLATPWAGGFGDFPPLVRLVA